MRKSAEQNVKAIYKHAHICENDYFSTYVYHEPCQDDSCCQQELHGFSGYYEQYRFVGPLSTSETQAWSNAWKKIQQSMLDKLES